METYLSYKAFSYLNEDRLIKESLQNNEISSAFEMNIVKSGGKDVKTFNDQYNHTWSDLNNQIKVLDNVNTKVGSMRDASNASGVMMTGINQPNNKFDNMKKKLKTLETSKTRKVYDKLINEMYSF